MRKLLFVFPFFAAGLLTGCRTYTPVERHFLRVPALAAAALAGPERAKWLKRSHRQPGFRQGALENQWIVLSATTRPPQVQVPPGEVRFFPEQAGSQAGVVALNWETGDSPSGQTRLYLLKTDGGRYIPIPLAVLQPGNTDNLRFSLGDQPDAVTAYRQVQSSSGVHWRKVATFRWSPQGWKADRVAGVP